MLFSNSVDTALLSYNHQSRHQMLRFLYLYHLTFKDTLTHKSLTLARVRLFTASNLYEGGVRSTLPLQVRGLKVKWCVKTNDLLAHLLESTISTHIIGALDFNIFSLRGDLSQVKTGFCNNMRQYSHDDNLTIKTQEISLSSKHARYQDTFSSKY